MRREWSMLSPTIAMSVNLSLASSGFTVTGPGFAARQAPWFRLAPFPPGSPVECPGDGGVMGDDGRIAAQSRWCEAPTTATGRVVSCSSFWLTDPSSARRTAPRPCEPTTMSCAPSAWARMD